MTAEDRDVRGDGSGGAKRRNPWIPASVAIAVLIAAAVLVLVFGREETQQPPAAGAAPASEPTSARGVTTTPPPRINVVELSADPEEWVGVEGPSGDPGCWVRAASVSCGTRTGKFDFPTPLPDENLWGGHPTNIVTLGADGDWVWTLGNMSLVGDKVVTLVDGITYRAHGWTIEPTRGGLTFSNDRTAHGMFVSVDRVDPF